MDLQIEPYTDGDVRRVLDDLTRNRELQRLLLEWQGPAWLRWLGPLACTLIGANLRRRVAGVDTIAAFQEEVARYVAPLVAETVTEFVVEGIDELDPNVGHLFLSNHRDIAGDSMLLNYALYQKGRRTLRIAVGDNLDQKSFATDLMRLNKSFFIQRSGTSPRKIYEALRVASQYIARSRDEGEPVWLAQSEGRAKDGIDSTDAAVLKMVLMNQRKRPVADAVNALGIVPMSLAYEFDPCDTRKARELTLAQREGSYQKQPGEDLDSLVAGLTGKKGRVVLRLGKPFQTSAETVEAVALELDQEIMNRLELFPVNYWALAQLAERGVDDYAEVFENIAPEHFVDPGDDVRARFAACEASSGEQWLRQYANPVCHRARVCQK